MENTPDSKVLKFEPQSIDFGCLIPGKGASATIKVHGGSGKVACRNDQLKASLTTFEGGNNVIEITLLPGSSGELIWDEFVLQTDTEECRVPVTVRWNEKAVEATCIENVVEATSEQSIKPTVPPPAPSPDGERSFIGRSCSLCGKNFPYNVDCHSWEQCTCRWYQKAWNRMANSTPMETVILIICALVITTVSWYPFVLFHNKQWLLLAIPLSIVSLPPAIILIHGLKKH